MQEWGKAKFWKKRETKQVAQLTQGEFNPICFKCGSPGHASRLCKAKSFQCLIPTCNSRSHNSEAHTAMEKAGKIVLPDKTPVASAATPQGKEVSLTQAQKK